MSDANAPPAFQTLVLRRQPGHPRILRLTLNRPERLNAISEGMPGEIRAAVAWAEADETTHVIVLDGAGRAFCAGYDLIDFGSGRTDHPCQQEAHLRRHGRLRGDEGLHRRLHGVVALPEAHHRHGARPRRGRRQRHRVVL